jgi:Na+-transporting NADH:ubiquinone oxidoreductase subunit NqrB
MTLVIVALLPHLFFGIYNAGYQSHLASGLSLAPWRSSCAACGSSCRWCW